MNPVTLGSDDTRIDTLADASRLILKGAVEDAVREAMAEERRASATVEATPTNDEDDAGGGSTGGRGLLFVVGLVLVGGAAYLANRRGWLPFGGSDGFRADDTGVEGADVGGGTGTASDDEDRSGEEPSETPTV